jgi:hypothetical protein
MEQSIASLRLFLKGEVLNPREHCPRIEQLERRQSKRRQPQEGRALRKKSNALRVEIGSEG